MVVVVDLLDLVEEVQLEEVQGDIELAQVLLVEEDRRNLK